MRFFLIIAIILFAGYGSAQNNTNSSEKFAIFIISDLDSWDDARALDQELRAESGIIMSRTDYNTKRYYAIFSANSGIDEQWFNTKLASKNYTISCYHEGISGVDEFIPITEDTCNE